MKKQLLLLVVILLPMVARAASVEIDGIYYELVSKAKQATVKGAVLTSGNLIIPASVTYEKVEYSVTSIEYRRKCFPRLQRSDIRSYIRYSRMV